MTERMFPVHSASRKKFPDLPKEIPWAFIAQYERRAQSNHDQTLARLAERGGLDWTELYWCVMGLPYGVTRREEKFDRENADGVLSAVAVWREAQ